ncbi:hypothetical protein [Methylocystis parvus]|uniref:Pentapeptide MXKDX repeat protein n=1 Tax=Methylocystis parvus TaxID=134 RepID=A0A6B8M7J3_9HYPH|nr:hypothetical protein [Methylocystis parvus]QGM97619.1 hypothetical protein F7D14_09195 [Methylocystis parvus]WBJ98448.1 hypothetical protein MMG94_10395 [Methylocystis parvus OBBP]
MTRYKLLSMTFAGLLALGVSQAVADADVDGMDHSHLNHGVMGRASHEEMHSQQANAAVKQASDPNVEGMDHSKLNHGVLGSPSHQEAKGAPPAQAAPAGQSGSPTTIWKSPTR